MKRDWDLIRRILLKIEEQPTLESVVRPDMIEGFDAETVSFHMQLMKEAGLINATCNTNTFKPNCIAKSLTWQGYEFHDNIRADTLWNRVLVIAKEKGFDLSFDTIKAAVGALVKQMVNE